MKIILFTIFLTLCGIYSYGQAKIEVKRNRYYMADTKLSFAQVVATVKTNEAAIDYAKIAKSNYSAASVFGFIGGFLVGWPVGTAIAGGDPQWELAGIGAGVILIAIPFASKANQNITKAIEIYNNGLPTSQNVSLSFGTTRSGVGFAFSF